MIEEEDGPDFSIALNVPFATAMRASILRPRMALGVCRFRLEFYLYFFLAVWPWTVLSTSLNLICEAENAIRSLYHWITVQYWSEEDLWLGGEQTLYRATCPWSRDRTEEDKVKPADSSIVCNFFLQREEEIVKSKDRQEVWWSSSYFSWTEHPLLPRYIPPLA